MSSSNPMASPRATRTATSTPQGGSTTVEVRPQPVLRLSAPSGVLRLRAQPAERRRIQWAEDVVDNEGMGKKSSKVCCIYHKPRAADESSDDDSSDSSDSDSSDSDSEPDNSTARPSGRAVGQRGRPHQHEHGDCEDEHDGGKESGKPQKRNRPRRKPSPNAYEKMPRNKK